MFKIFFRTFAFQERTEYKKPTTQSVNTKLRLKKFNYTEILIAFGIQSFLQNNFKIYKKKYHGNNTCIVYRLQSVYENEC